MQRIGNFVHFLFVRLSFLCLWPEQIDAAADRESIVSDQGQNLLKIHGEHLLIKSAGAVLNGRHRHGRASGPAYAHRTRL